MGDVLRSTLLDNYQDVDTRATRTEYWYFVRFTIAVHLVFHAAAVALAHSASLTSLLVVELLIQLVLFVPALAVSVRRLHDTGRSGWWLLLGLTVVGVVPVLVWMCTDSEGDNLYGPCPYDF